MKNAKTYSLRKVNGSLFSVFMHKIDALILSGTVFQSVNFKLFN